MVFSLQIPERIAFRQALRKQYDESYIVVEGTELALAQQAGLRHILSPVRGRPLFNAVFNEVIEEHAQQAQENAAGLGLLDIFQWFIDNFDQILEIITKLLPLFV